MRFTYTYRSSDGQRHTAEIEAESRDAAFARVRNELGIKPIKVVATGDHATGGGTVDGYLTELEKRQRLEVSYRERAEQKLNELLAAANGQAARSTDGRDKRDPPAGRASSGNTSDALKAAYAYWLKANAQLQAMGIYPLALPDVLRSYQMNLDIEE
jgi:hypothetical protein